MDADSSLEYRTSDEEDGIAKNLDSDWWTFSSRSEIKLKKLQNLTTKRRPKIEID